MTQQARVGIGLRQPHYAELLNNPPPLDFVEVHSENFFADGGAALGVLMRARERYPVSLHGVGLGLGSAAGLDPWHLDRLERLVERVEPVRVSDHASFARAARADAGFMPATDLLPIAFTSASLEILACNVSIVQERLRRPILVENVSAYLSFADDSIGEPAFLAELCRRSGCGLLLDLNNLLVNAVNALRHEGADERPAAGDDGVTALERCRAAVDAIPPAIVGEIHLAGYTDAGALAIDDHGSRVRPAVWALFKHAVRRIGPRPVLIEWDTKLPPLEVLLDEADRVATRAGSPECGALSARAA